MNRFVSFLVFINLASGSYAQQTGRLEADRPDYTESAIITKHKYIQAEIGLGLYKQNGFKTLVLPTILWKYGISKKVELRLNTEMNVVETPVSIPFGNEVYTGIIPVIAGAKFHLLEEHGIIPQTAILVQLIIPKAASSKFQANRWAPSIIFLSQNTINDKIEIGYNYGLEWDGETKRPLVVYTLSAGFNFGTRWTSFVELFGSARKGDLPENNLDTGLGYYINDNVKLDASAGFGVSEAALNYFFGVGLSFRFH